VATNRWDHKLPTSILSDYELNCLPYTIRPYLHHCVGTPMCKDHDLCAMCGNAVRLVVQAAVPKIIDAVLERAAKAVGCNIDLHPQWRGDD
jgi:hypothetical protein